MNCFTNEDELPSGATSQPSKSSLPGLKKQVRHNLLLAVRGVKKVRNHTKAGETVFRNLESITHKSI